MRPYGEVERRVRHSEREMLEAAYAQNSAPDIHVRTALATAIGISEKQVTAWYTRRQQTGRAPYGVTPGSQNAPPQPAGSQQHPGSMGGRDAQPALVTGRHYITERYEYSAPVPYDGIV